jgi:hypothetical protein
MEVSLGAYAEKRMLCKLAKEREERTSKCMQRFMNT